MSKVYDYIITGTGAAGLLVAYRMASDTFYDQKKILLLDKAEKSENDRTWSFWDDQKNFLSDIITKKWDQIYFGSKFYEHKGSIDPYVYQVIRSKSFYNFVLDLIGNKDQFEILNENVIGLKDKDDLVEVNTNQGLYFGKKVLNSIPFSKAYKSQKKYPILNQHFIGWFIETEENAFDASTAVFMDFKLPQKGNTRFIYILPFTEKKALVEYTLFSKDLLENSEYEEAIERYLENKNITNYSIIEKEQGCIPMTSFRFQKSNTKNILNIGTAGGWTKASTGYTFKNALKKSNEVVEFLKNQDNFQRFEAKDRFWWYDLLFLDVLSKHNGEGAHLFSRMFSKNPVPRILKFLDEETSFSEELKIMWSMPKRTFIKATLSRLFSGF